MMSGTFKQCLQKAATGVPLSGPEANFAFQCLLSGDASEVQMAAFATALHMRGETVEEISAACAVLRARAVQVRAPEDAIDMVGTGGDGVGTLNISTGAAIVTAACGVKVAKHGNKAQSSKSGAADVLAALGVKLDLSPDRIEECIAEVGLGFMFAPNHHAALGIVAPVRKQLGFRTVFNLLGPLCNPAQVKRQLVGVFAEKWLQPFAEVLRSLGSTRAWVVHSDDGLDEITVTGPTQIAELSNGSIRRFSIAPHEAGLPLHSMSALLGGDANENAEALRNMLDGATGAYRDIVCLNAAAALIVAGRTTSLREGVTLASLAIDSGAARATLGKLVTCSQQADPDILARIADYKRKETMESQARVSLQDMERRARDAPPVRKFVEHLQQTIAAGRYALIAEIKKASPSKGVIRADFDPPALARAYENGGATCLSVLTDAPSFQGSNEFLMQARAATTLPVLRKDFMFEPYQVVEARALGADCILIIMAAVSDGQAKALSACAREWGMDVLVEVHCRAELDRALQLSPALLGINNRDLQSFRTSLSVTEELAPIVPKTSLIVSESGINTHGELERLSKVGVKAFLVGESLMRRADVEQATRDLLGGYS